MKKRIFSLLCCIVLLASVFCFVACGNTELKEFENITFADSAVTYDGESHSLSVSGVPDFATVSYNQNGFVREGTYTITAYVMADGYKTWQKSATLTITQVGTLGLRYTYNGEGYTVIGYDGESSEVIIPATYKGKPVTQIGDAYTYPFAKKDYVTSVVLTENIVDVSLFDFNYKNLKFNEYEGGYYLGTATNPYYALVTTRNPSTGDVSFEGKISNNTKLLGCGESLSIKSGISKIDIPQGVKYIGEAVFYGADNMTISVPSSVIKIAYGAFGNRFTENLTVEIKDIASWCAIDFEESWCIYSSVKLSFPYEEMTLFGESEYCLRVPDGVEKINDFAHLGLAEAVVYVPNSVKEIGTGVFDYSFVIFESGSQLKEFYIDSLFGVDFLPKSVEKIVVSINKKTNDILYEGTKEEWEKIEICKSNDTEICVLFYSKADPTDDENEYWHYVDGVPTMW